MFASTLSSKLKQQKMTESFDNTFRNGKNQMSLGALVVRQLEKLFGNTREIRKFAATISLILLVVFWVWVMLSNAGIYQEKLTTALTIVMIPLIYRLSADHSATN